MPTVASAFDQFFANINLSGDHRATANARKDRIVTLLEKDFEILDAFATGSIPKYTALATEADLDVFVVLHYGKHIKDNTPRQVLESIQSALSGKVVRVRKNGQAVTLTYTTWPNVDIVPVAIFTTDGNPASPVLYYNVPNANTGGWIPSNPKKHAEDVENWSTTCGPNFRRIIKMVKHWNDRHSAYLTGYHIEVLALKIFSSDLSDLPWQIYQFFDQATNLVAVPLYQDRGYVDDYLSQADRTEILRRLATARDRALSAWHAGFEVGKTREAVTAWRVLFGDKFPSYD